MPSVVSIHANVKRVLKTTGLIGDQMNASMALVDRTIVLTALLEDLLRARFAMKASTGRVVVAMIAILTQRVSSAKGAILIINSALSALWVTAFKMVSVWNAIVTHVPIVVLRLQDVTSASQATISSTTMEFVFHVKMAAFNASRSTSAQDATRTCIRSSVRLTYSALVTITEGGQTQTRPNHGRVAVSSHSTRKMENARNVTNTSQDAHHALKSVNSANQ